jgi:UDP-N-acetylmuramoylalanine--D-glutamate ligase
MKKIGILGFGREGQAVLRFLKKRKIHPVRNKPRRDVGAAVVPKAGPVRIPKGASSIKKSVTELYSPMNSNGAGRIFNGAGADIWVLDKNSNLRAPRGIKTILGKKYLSNLGNFDVVFRSPGLPYRLPEIQKAIKKGVAFSSSTEIFFKNAKGLIIGITGTKGKGTTAALLYKILKSCDKNVYLVGNIGSPTINVLSKLKKNSISILELSSFQLQDLKYSPQIAVILGIFPEHLDMHKNFREYVEAKSNICRYQTKKDVVFFQSDDKWSRWIAQKSRGKKITVSVPSRPLPLKIPGEHNLKNAAMAATVAEFLKCPKAKILKTVKNFCGLEHRLEFVREIKHSNILQNVGISFYNDSASTNPQTAAAAIKAFTGLKILIAGGKNKKLNYAPLAKALKNSNTKAVILFGENKKKIKKVISSQKLVIREVKNLSHAVQLAYQTAKALITNYHLPITVLFSPASTSFDMFRDYKDRGEKFKSLLFVMGGRRFKS